MGPLVSQAGGLSSLDELARACRLRRCFTGDPIFVGYTPCDELFAGLVREFGRPPGGGNGPANVALVPVDSRTDDVAGSWR